MILEFAEVVEAASALLQAIVQDRELLSLLVAQR